MIQINFHGSKFTSRSQLFDKGLNSDSFCTFEINSDGNNVTVFLKDVDAARRLVDAAVEAYRNCEAIELENRIDAVVGEIPVFGGQTVLDSDGTYTEDDQGNWHEITGM